MFEARPAYTAGLLFFGSPEPLTAFYSEVSHLLEVRD